MRISAIAVLAGVAGAAQSAHAFCGFYVSGSGDKMFNDATQVVLMRDGTRTVLSMQNDYRGPLEDFALVVPVPVVLHEDDVKTLEQSVFDHVESLGSPRLVEYWEQDPCPADYDSSAVYGPIGGVGMGYGNAGTGRGGMRGQTVTIEAKFDVGEYKILVLS